MSLEDELLKQRLERIREIEALGYRAYGRRYEFTHTIPDILAAYGAKTREMIIEQVKGLIGEGDAVVAWDAPNDAGFVFETFGANRRVPVDFDGLQLVAFHPRPDAANGSV